MSPGRESPRILPPKPDQARGVPVVAMILDRLTLVVMRAKIRRKASRSSRNFLPGGHITEAKVAA